MLDKPSGLCLCKVRQKRRGIFPAEASTHVQASRSWNSNSPEMYHINVTNALYSHIPIGFWRISLASHHLGAGKCLGFQISARKTNKWRLIFHSTSSSVKHPSRASLFQKVIQRRLINLSTVFCPGKSNAQAGCTQTLDLHCNSLDSTDRKTHPKTPKSVS
jgi:hypothetical protein